MQTRYDPYLQVDEGWDESTEELVTEIFMLAGNTSRTLLEMHYRIAILRSKVRPETFLKLVNAIPREEERREFKTTCLDLLNLMAQMKTQISSGP